MAHRSASVQSLRRFIEARSTQGNGRNICRAVEAFLQENRGQVQEFFEECFQPLIKRIFGFESGRGLLKSSGGSERSKDMQALLRLLAPDGLLFKAIFKADADGLVQFTFPLDKLPTYSQKLMESASGLARLSTWPQYAGRVRVHPLGQGTQLHLLVFEYFIMWMAFYPQVTRVSAGWKAPAQSFIAPVSNIVNVASALPSFTSSRSSSNQPYFRILCALLAHFLPQPAPPVLPAGATGGEDGGGRSAASLHGSRYFGGPGTEASGQRDDVRQAAPPSPASPVHASMMINILAEFWLTDADEPLPMEAGEGAADGSPGGGAAAEAVPPGGMWSGVPSAAVGPPAQALRGRAGSAMGVPYTPPPESVMKALTLLVQHLTVDRRGGGTLQPVQRHEAWLPPVAVTILWQLGLPPGQAVPPASLPLDASSLLGAVAAPPFQTLAMRLYRLLRRTFLYCQADSSAVVRSALELWMAVAMPWRCPATARPSFQLPHPAAAAGAAAFGSSHHAGAAAAPPVGSGSGSPASSGHSSQADGSGEAELQEYHPALWREHVLALLPFFLGLLPQILDLLCHQAAQNSADAISDLLKVLQAFEGEPGLLQDLRDAEDALWAADASPAGAGGGAGAAGWAPAVPFAPHPAAALSGEGGLLLGVGATVAVLRPFLLAQLSSWETAATARRYTPGSAPQQPMRMFTNSEQSAEQLAVKILRSFQGRVQDARKLRRLRQGLHALFGQMSQEASAEGQLAMHARLDALDNARMIRTRLPSGAHSDRDPLRLPIASNELPHLARLLVWLSEAINAALGLHGRYGPPPAADGNAATPGSRRSAALQLLLQPLHWLRKQQFRVNLRPFAEVQTLVWSLATLFLLVSLSQWLTTNEQSNPAGGHG